MIDYQMLFESAPNPYLILDSKLSIVGVNAAYLDVTMTKREELIGRYLFDAFPANPEDLNANGVSNLQASLEGVLHNRVADTMAVQKYDIPIRGSEGRFEERFWCSVNSPVLDVDNEVQLIIHNAQDVTQYVRSQVDNTENLRVERSLKNKADRLELEIYKSAQAQQEANRALKKASDAKSMFLTSMSHELRTPLNAVLGFGQVLELNPAEPLTLSQKECVDQILKGGKHLLNLINDVLDLSRVEAGNTDLHLTDVSIRRVLADVLALVDVPTAENRGITLINESIMSDSLLVLADFTRVKQIVFNLVSNAIKYNREGGRVTVNCEPIDGNMVRISVKDTGQGIEEEKRKDLFVPFKRLGAETTSIIGSGIGLVLVKKMVELMGGSVGYESKVGFGSTFWVDLKVSQQGAVHTSPTQIQFAKPVKMPVIEGTMLYVEDNQANMALMKKIVSNIEGLTLLSAQDAEAGIDMARTNQPDLVVLDVHLPRMDGFQALRVLNGDPKTAHIPVVALSAAATESDIFDGIKAGFKDYLAKPVDVFKLSEVVRNAILQ